MAPIPPASPIHLVPDTMKKVVFVKGPNWKVCRRSVECHRFTKQQDATIKRLYKKQVKWKDIGERIGRSADSCSARYHRRLAPQRKHRRYDKHNWTESEEQQLLGLSRQGKTYHQIAKGMPGRTSAACELKLRRLLALEAESGQKQISRKMAIRALLNM